MKDTIKVSIVTISYNQENYIREALDSFLEQETSFKFEILIADDHSTDGTPAILKEYAKQHPDLIRLILRDENVGAAENCIKTLNVAQGEYIALCEGDDYWTDKQKLQKQADFLDANEEYALCFHPVKVIFEGNSKKEYIYPESKGSSKFNNEELFKQNFIQTNSVMYRRQKYNAIPTNILPLDWYLHLYHAQFGKIGFINKVMGAYRRHPGGIWWDSDKNIDEIWKKYGLAHLGLYVEVKKLSGAQGINRKIIDAHITRMFNVLIETDKKYKSEMLGKAIKKYPSAAETFMVDDYNHIRAMDMAAAEKDKTLQAQQHEIARQELIVADKDELLHAIRSSRSWRLRNKLAKLTGRGAV